jgi:hypothetical protein
MFKDGVIHFKATATQSQPKSKSLRITLPPLAVEYHQMKPGMDLEWGFDPMTGALWIAEVNKKKVKKP